jgi:hypothetical protein
MDVDDVDMIFGDENVGDNAFDDVDVGGAPQSHNNDSDDKSSENGGCGDSCSHDFDCGCVDDGDDVDNDLPSTPTLDVSDDDCEYNVVTSATTIF